MANHDPPHLFLVDGYALIYRAFFALITRPLRTAKGENTSAAWGVTNFLLRLREKYRPDYLVWVNDAGDSFRTAEYAEYKSTREKLDDELQADFDRAVERVRELLTGFRIPLVEVAGYEADDVIGTLALRAAAQGLQSVIVSGDKDFYQLIRPGIALLNPGRGGPAGVDEVWVTEANAAERLGVPPHQVADWLALVGDTSDNVPGVRGIGEKGAVQLLQEYGDLESMIERRAEIKQKRAREALEISIDVARLSRRLVTIKTDVPAELDLTALQSSIPDRQALARTFAALEFHSLLPRLDRFEALAAEVAVAVVESIATAPALDVPVVTDPADLTALASALRAAPLMAFDCETSSLQPHDAELIGLSLAASPTEVWYLSFGHRNPPGTLFMAEGAADARPPVVNLPPITDPACVAIRALLEDATVPKAGHNIKYDTEVLRRAGIEVRGIAYDSMLASFVLDPSRRSHGIDALALEFLGASMTQYTDLCGKGKNEIPFAEVPVDKAASYCGADSATVLALHAHFAPELARTSLQPLLDRVEMPLVPVLVDMEWAGIAIDGAQFADLGRTLAQDLSVLEAAIQHAAGDKPLNINSPRQLAAILFTDLGLPVLKKTKTGPSTDADVLEQLADQGHELPRLILSYRELQKLKSTYVDVLPLEVNAETHRIHTSFNQVGAQTGRLSSSDPNLQNIPVRSVRGEAIRRGFVPAAGWKFVVADYSQIELRLMAHLSGDPAFIEAFRRGDDIHRQTAAIIFGVPLTEVTGEMRSRAKTINFGTIYGQGPFALSKQLGIPQDEARRFISDYFTRFAGVRAYLDRQVELAREQGFVETLFGRRRYINEINDRNFNIRSFGERTAQNTPLQGSAADLIKIAMARVHQALPAAGLDARLLLQVHDELVVEAPAAEAEQAAALLKEHMEGAAELAVPLKVSVGIGDNWMDAKH
ncbi:MAG TPA: DNA polymerase I [Gemmatimonadales bacterium]|jgi:DNA polymerase-1|nr:DNA polymerase I [Gemmatimonadales bacterium]